MGLGTLFTPKTPRIFALGAPATIPHTPAEPLEIGGQLQAESDLSDFVLEVHQSVAVAPARVRSKLGATPLFPDTALFLGI